MENQTLTKEKQIAELMKGMTYKEWTNFRDLINGTFESEAAKQNKNIVFTASPEFEECLNHLF